MALVRRFLDGVRRLRPSRGGRAPGPMAWIEQVRPGEAITVSYSPEIDGDADPGEVVWGWVPFDEAFVRGRAARDTVGDATLGKDRPMVVVGRQGAYLVGVPLTSRRDERDPQVAVGAGGWDRSGRPSYARLDRVIRLDPRDVRREGSVLAADRFDALVDALGRRFAVERR